jgi:hypothetical protein
MSNDDPVEPNHHIQHQYSHNIRFCALCGFAQDRIVAESRG